jgi:hypothetical protein
MVGWPRASQPRAPTESVRDNLSSYGSCRPGHLAAGFAQAQCAKYRGRLTAALAMTPGCRAVELDLTWTEPLTSTQCLDA